jgi:ketopantoate reductase
MLTTPGSKLASSMYRDLSNGARVEADQILGDLLERGQGLGIAAPLVEAAFVNLRIYLARLVELPWQQTGRPLSAGKPVLGEPLSKS